MTLLQDLKNVADGLFIHRIENTTVQVGRAERQRNARLKRKKQIDQAILSTGIHHRESLFKKWGRN